MNANNTHNNAGIQPKSSSPRSLAANAKPIITGTAAPVSVFGREASIHAFAEFVSICFSFMI